MKKICTYSGTYHAYSVPYQKMARIYESEEPVFKGCPYEVSTHNGSLSEEWQFKPFKTIEEAQAYALSFIAPSHIECKPKLKD